MLFRSLVLVGLLAAGCAAAGCAAADEVVPLARPGLPAARFPRPVRAVAPVVSDRWSDEDTREHVGEADEVMGFLGVHPGEAVADIGAGSGYYAVRLARRVGPGGRVLAQDIMPNYLAELQRRVVREGLSNVTVGLGDPHDPRLPAGSVDLALMVHMYHEIEQPFGLLVNLLPALRPGAQVAILDATRETQYHGTPVTLLQCELASVGYKQVGFHWLDNHQAYVAVFTPPAAAPAPESIRPCRP